jgi:hypothetical protein
VTSLRRLLPLLALPPLALPLVACIETRLDVEILTQIHANGTCTRRIEYRLEQVDPDKGNARVAIQPADDPLRLHRFPTGEPWLRTEETDVGHRVVVVEALLPTPQDVDGDYFRARSPRTPPARNIVSAFVDAEAAVYEYQEVFRDPASPLAAARALSRGAVKQDDVFVERFKAEIGAASPRDELVRRGYRELLAEPFAREVAALAERPLFGPRERRELEEVYERLDGRQKSLAARLAQQAPDAPADTIDKAVSAGMDRVGDNLIQSLEAAGLPIVLGQGELKLRFRATLVMPVPIVSANTCVSGDAATWEFDQDDLYGRGFEMKASAFAR